MRDGVRLWGDAIAEEGPEGTRSLDSSSRNRDPCRLGVEAWWVEEISVVSGFESGGAIESRREGEVVRNCC